MKLEGMHELFSMGVLTALQTDEITQYISLGLTLLVSITTIVLNVVKAVKHAKNDGKISIDEVQNIIEEVKTGVEEVNKVVKEEIKNAK